MRSAATHDVTRWLQAWGRGDESALEKLVPLVYRELHRRARRFMGRERAGHSLRPTALIHEAYLRLVGLVRLDEALLALAATDERKSRVVEQRFFGGLSVEETAGVLEVSPQTVLRDWKLAKAWLQREMKRGDGDGR